jgi:hypothetical protein
MRKLNYNFHEAIALRGKTIEESGLADEMHPSVRQQVITFQMSINMTIGNQEWPEIPLVYDVLGNGPDVQARRVTKDRWKGVYGEYRKFMKYMFADVKFGPSH